jgi:hypothetical protein
MFVLNESYNDTRAVQIEIDTALQYIRMSPATSNAVIMCCHLRFLMRNTITDEEIKVCVLYAKQ